MNDPDNSAAGSGDDWEYSFSISSLSSFAPEDFSFPLQQLYHQQTALGAISEPASESNLDPPPTPRPVSQSPRQNPNRSYSAHNSHERPTSSTSFTQHQLQPQQDNHSRTRQKQTTPPLHLNHHDSQQQDHHPQHHLPPSHIPIPSARHHFPHPPGLDTPPPTSPRRKLPGLFLNRSATAPTAPFLPSPASAPLSATARTTAPDSPSTPLASRINLPVSSRPASALPSSYSHSHFRPNLGFDSRPSSIATSGRASNVASSSSSPTTKRARVVPATTLGGGRSAWLGSVGLLHIGVGTGRGVGLGEEEEDTTEEALPLVATELGLELKPKLGQEWEWERELHRADTSWEETGRLIREASSVEGESGAVVRAVAEGGADAREGRKGAVGAVAKRARKRPGSSRRGEVGGGVGGGRGGEEGRQVEVDESRGYGQRHADIDSGDEARFSVDRSPAEEGLVGHGRFYGYEHQRGEEHSPELEASPEDEGEPEGQEQAQAEAERGEWHEDPTGIDETPGTDEAFEVNDVQQTEESDTEPLPAARVDLMERLCGLVQRLSSAKVGGSMEGEVLDVLHAKVDEMEELLVLAEETAEAEATAEDDDLAELEEMPEAETPSKAGIREQQREEADPEARATPTEPEARDDAQSEDAAESKPSSGSSSALLPVPLLRLDDQHIRLDDQDIRDLESPLPWLTTTFRYSELLEISPTQSHPELAAATNEALEAAKEAAQAQAEMAERVAEQAEKMSLELVAVIKRLHARKEESDHLHTLLIDRAEAAATRILDLEKEIGDLEDDIQANESELRHLRLKIRAVETVCYELVPAEAAGADPDLLRSIENWKADWVLVRDRMLARKQDRRARRLRLHRKGCVIGDGVEREGEGKNGGAGNGGETVTSLGGLSMTASLLGIKSSGAAPKRVR